MANSKGSSGIRNLMYPGKHALLPPKSPFPSVSQAYADYVSNPPVGSKAANKPREGNAHHQRTSSESVLIEEQPLWLDDLLNEPDTPVKRGGHRRSSSDSFAYMDSVSASNMGYADQDEHKYKNFMPIPSWSSQDFDRSKEASHVPMYAEMNIANQRNRSWDSFSNAMTNLSGVPGKNNVAFQRSGSPTPCIPHEADGLLPTANDKRDSVESGLQDTKLFFERKDGSHAKPSSSETDTKRAKQQFAQRSRVRKLQYIAELERNVQALQSEGSEVSAELEFLNQQNLILSMENKALKQRLESLAQEQLIKYLEQEVLEREIGRLRAVYQQQLQPTHQPQQLPSGSHRRTNSRDLESQLANLSLKHRDTNSGHDPATGALRI